MPANNSTVTITPWPLIVAENTPIDTVIASVAVVDPDNLLGASLWTGTDFFRFVQTGTGQYNLVVNGPIDYEALTDGKIDIQIRVVDRGSPRSTDYHSFSIDVSDQVAENENNAPTGLTLNTATIAENSAVDTVVGTLSATDPDAGETFTYTLVDNPGGLFKIDGDELQVASPIDYETVGGTVTIKVQVSDGDATFEKELNIEVADVAETGNQAPTDLSLSVSSIAENSAVDTVVGMLSATDPDAGETFTYTLVDDLGGLFKIDGDELQVAGPIDYETVGGTVTIKVQVSDGEATFEKELDIQVTDVNENANQAPTDIEISSTTIKESARTGFTVGTLSATDPDGGAITWSLVAGQGDNDAKFGLKTVDGETRVVLKSPLDHESSGGVYDLVVRATDSAGNFTDKVIQITAEDEPFAISGVPTGKDYMSVIESAPAGTQIGFIWDYDYDDAFNPVSARLTDDADGMFSITPGFTFDRFSGTDIAREFLTVNGDLDLESDDKYSVTIEVTGTDGTTRERTIDIHVADAAEATDPGIQPEGTITVDANTALAASNGGVNWTTYLDVYFDKILGGLPTFYPNGSGWSAGNPATEMRIQNNTSDGTLISIKGSDFFYNWADPVSGEDVHVITGTITEVTFGGGGATGSAIQYELVNPELTISGLALSNNADPLNRLFGEAQIFTQSWMYGNTSQPSDIEFTKAILASYAQNFKGSGAGDTYAGTIFADTVAGNGGADTLAGGGGNDNIDGGEGSDSAMYSGNKADYTVTENNDGSWTVADRRTGAINDGSDTIKNVEKLQFADETVTLSTPANQSPSDPALSANSVAENAAMNTVVGTLSATDPEGQPLTYALTNDAGGKFSLVTEGTGAGAVVKLVVAGALDYETATSHQVMVTVSDGVNEVSSNITINVTDIADNRAPTTPTLSASTVAENAASGTVVGMLAATDADGDSLTYTLTNNAGGKFSLVTEGTGASAVTKIVVSGALDYETATSHQIGVKVSDGKGGEATQTFTVGVTDVDDAALLGTIELNASGAGGIDFESYIRGGFLTGTTGSGMPVFDNGGAFTGEEMFIGYGTGASNKYVLMHGSLTYNFSTHTVGGSANTIEYGTRGSGSFDGNGYFTGGNVALKITGLNLSNPAMPGSNEAEVEANGPIHNFATAHMYGASGDLSRLGKYADALDAYAQKFVGSAGSDTYTGTRFNDTIEGKGGTDVFDGGAGNDMIVYSGIKANYTVAVNSTTGAGTITHIGTGAVTTLLHVESARFDDGTVQLIAGANQAPTGLALSASTVSEDAAVDTVIGTLAATDLDGDVLSYTLTNNAQGRFKLVTAGNVTQLVLATAVDFETAASHPITVEASDGKGGVAMQSFVIAVTDVVDEENTAPTGLALSNSTINENAADGTVVGQLSAQDGQGDDITWSLSGGGGKFALETVNGVTQLVVNGNLNYEARSSYDVTVTASDGELASQETFTINVADLANEVIAGGGNSETLTGGGTADTIRAGGGNDALVGGGGADRLIGGAGADTFLFGSVNHSRPKAYDTITDLKPRQGDIIDLSGIDANKPKDGNQGFDFIGRDDFNGRAGELRFEKSQGSTVIEGDVSGDGKADFVLHLLGNINVNEDFLIL